MSESTAEKRCTAEERLETVDQMPVAYFELDAEGRIIYVNRAGCAALQRERADLLGTVVWNYVAPDEVKQGQQAYLRAMAEGDLRPIRRTLFSTHGRFRTYELLRSLIHDKDGHAIGIRCVMVDVTEAKTEHEEAHRSRLWLESVLESVAEGVIVTDALGFVRFMNRAAEELSGWTTSELCGKVIEKGLPLLAYEEIEGGPITHNLALETRCKGIATLLDRSRNSLRVELSTAPIIDKENGYTVGVVTVMRPV